MVALKTRIIALLKDLGKEIGRAALYMRRFGILKGVIYFWRSLLGECGFLNRKDIHILRKKRLYQMPCPGKNFGMIWLRSGTSDLSVYEQVLIREDYNTRRFSQNEKLREMYRNVVRAEKRPVIIDCGANIGCSSVWFSHEFPEATVCAVEPHPQTSAVLRMNTETNPNIVAVEAAVWSSSTTLKIERPHGDSWAIRVSNISQREEPEITVPALTMDDILRKVAGDTKLFIVKIDIEGAESELFQSNVDWVASTPLIVVELHDWMLPWKATSNTVLDTLLKQRRDYLFVGDNLFCFLHPD